jgi:hypothetical protein
MRFTQTYILALSKQKKHNQHANVCFAPRPSVSPLVGVIHSMTNRVSLIQVQ